MSSQRQQCGTLVFKLLQSTVAHNGTKSLAHQGSSWSYGLGQAGSTAGHCSNSTGTPAVFRAVRQLLGNRSLATQSTARTAARTTGAETSGQAAAKQAKGSAQAAAGSTPAHLSQFEQWRERFRQIPTVPKWLGLAGAIPFIALAPPVCKHLAPLLPTVVSENCAMVQVCYGVVIVTFLGAVHWGVAMASPLSGPLAAKLASDAYVYSVIPSLLAWPVALMEPGAASILLSLLLPGCYLADYTRRNLGMPAWYMTLRLPLTILATFGMLLTATRYYHAEMDRVKEAEQAAALREQQSAAGNSTA